LNTLLVYNCTSATGVDAAGESVLFCIQMGEGGGEERRRNRGKTEKKNEGKAVYNSNSKTI